MIVGKREREREREREEILSNGDIGKTSHNQFLRFVFIKTGLLMYNKSYESAKESINKLYFHSLSHDSVSA